MKLPIITLFAVVAFAAFTTTFCFCSEKRVADATTENTATGAGNTTGNAVGNAKADVAREPGDTAMVQNQPVTKIVEEISAKQR
ncbi:hypothetical protein IC235_03940 [Hymenobacter sp. BT664]|uniref:Secreted protein n=1 Tax=Hymenobacter montanus TaxID=2771359 RepID=A0A927BBC6_9BACT|nr:hypothetical protein [Hymenobacter montanus]MBD2767044.1 hypothetical protein [Hymenobacter montanus]